MAFTLSPPRPRNPAEAAVVAAFRTFGCDVGAAESTRPRGTADPAPGRKSFDFFVRRRGSGDPQFWLVEVKERRAPGTSPDAWIGLDDANGLRAWEDQWRPHGEGLLVFVTRPDRFNCRQIHAVVLRDFLRRAKHRSRRWQTIYVPPAAFAGISQPLNRVIDGAPPRPIPVYRSEDDSAVRSHKAAP